MDEFFVGILCAVSLCLSVVCICMTVGHAEDCKEHCYYCEHVELEENNGYCLDGKHYMLEDGVLMEIGDCFAK